MFVSHYGFKQFNLIDKNTCLNLLLFSQLVYMKCLSYYHFNYFFNDNLSIIIYYVWTCLIYLTQLHTICPTYIDSLHNLFSFLALFILYILVVCIVMNQIGLELELEIAIQITVIFLVLVLCLSSSELLLHLFPH